MTINRYRYCYERAFSLFGDHTRCFIEKLAEQEHAASTIKLYLSCINGARDRACHRHRMDSITRNLCQLYDEALRELPRGPRSENGASSSFAERSCTLGIAGGL
ncbi:hypothetical protein LJR255_004863 [Pararhizobium sp. LjRoot255]|uniref:hypothetical protein n=1 Tax=Pararhizobium sp. LjRoot255 TaxID=3342298 RepID=UPI003ECC9748